MGPSEVSTCLRPQSSGALSRLEEKVGSNREKKSRAAELNKFSEVSATNGNAKGVGRKVEFNKSGAKECRTLSCPSGEVQSEQAASLKEGIVKKKGTEDGKNWGKKKD